jgi:hypothetical protein
MNAAKSFNPLLFIHFIVYFNLVKHHFRIIMSLCRRQFYRRDFDPLSRYQIPP